MRRYTARYIIPDFILVILTLIMTGVVKGCLLSHMAEYSFFTPDLAWLRQFISIPGGLLDYFGAYFTQFCTFPLLGAAMLAAFMVGLSHLLRQSCLPEDDGRAVPYLSCVPSILLILFVTDLDYSAYTLKSYGTVFSQVIGLTIALALYVGYRRMSKNRLGRCLVPLFTLIAFPLFGFYAIVPVLMVLFSRPMRSSPGGVALLSLAILAAPCISSLVQSKVNLRYCLLGGLPYMDFVGNVCKLAPLAGAILISALFPLSRCIKGETTSVLCSLAALACLFAFTNWDANFNSVLKMEQAAGRLDWDEVLEEAARCGHPTRVQVIYRNIALYQKSELCERMFEYPDGSEPLKTRAEIPMTFVYAPEAYLRSGLVNYAERWATELSVTYTKNFRYLKCLLKVAILTSDFELAEKYMSVLGRAMFQKKETQRFSAMIDDPGMMSDDPEMRKILSLMSAKGPKLISGEVAESTILQHFASVEASNQDLYECKMASLLTLKREAAFMDEFINRQAVRTDRVPKGIAEAAVLFGGTSGDREIYLKVFEVLGDDKKLMKDFSAFANSYNASSDLSSQRALDRYRRSFGHTYWFYYHFVNDISTN